MLYQVPPDALDLVLVTHADGLCFTIPELFQSLGRQVLLSTQGILIGVLINCKWKERTQCWLVHKAIDLLLADDKKYNTKLKYQLDPTDPCKRRSSILEEIM